MIFLSNTNAWFFYNSELLETCTYQVNMIHRIIKKNYLFLAFEVYNSDKTVYITKDERGIDFDFQ